MTILWAYLQYIGQHYSLGQWFFLHFDSHSTHPEPADREALFFVRSRLTRPERREKLLPNQSFSSWEPSRHIGGKKASNSMRFVAVKACKSEFGSEIEFKFTKKMRRIKRDTKLKNELQTWRREFCDSYFASHLVHYVTYFVPHVLRHEVCVLCFVSHVLRWAAEFD